MCLGRPFLAFYSPCHLRTCISITLSDSTCARPIFFPNAHLFLSPSHETTLHRQFSSSFSARSYLNCTISLCYFAIFLCNFTISLFFPLETTTSLLFRSDFRILFRFCSWQVTLSCALSLSRPNCN